MMKVFVLLFTVLVAVSSQVALRGPTDRHLAIVPGPCPMVLCVDPCGYYDKDTEEYVPKCPDGTCVTQSTSFKVRGQKCDGCPQFKQKVAPREPPRAQDRFLICD